jgi:hypothetical protein
MAASSSYSNPIFRSGEDRRHSNLTNVQDIAALSLRQIYHSKLFWIQPVFGVSIASSFYHAMQHPNKAEADRHPRGEVQPSLEWVLSPRTHPIGI